MQFNFSIKNINDRELNELFFVTSSRKIDVLRYLRKDFIIITKINYITIVK